jgi:hypothetical protein
MVTKVTNIITQIAYKNRAYAVIDSCISAAHFKAAERYVENYHHITDDWLGYQELLSHLNETRINSLYPQY